MLLLAGLFLLIYVLVYAGALLAEVLISSDASVDYYLRAASRDLIKAFPYATGIAALWIVIAYFFHQNMIDAVTGGEDVTRQQQPRLYNLLENLCISRGIPMPKLKVMQSDALNAFATGLNQRQYAVTVTTGLLKALNDQEIVVVVVVLFVFFVVVLFLFKQRRQELRRRWRHLRRHHRGRADPAGLAVVA